MGATLASMTNAEKHERLRRFRAADRLAKRDALRFALPPLRITTLRAVVADSGEQRTAWEGEVLYGDTPTGDGRELAIDGGSWRNLPIPLMAMFDDDHGTSGPFGGSIKSTNVGQIASLAWDGKTLKAGGSFATHADALRAVAGVESGDLNGISADPFPSEWTITFPAQPAKEELTEEEYENLIDAFWGENEEEAQITESIEFMPQVRFTKWRLMGATLVPFAAFENAKVRIPAASAAGAAEPDGSEGGGDASASASPPAVLAAADSQETIVVALRASEADPTSVPLIGVDSADAALTIVREIAAERGVFDVDADGVAPFMLAEFAVDVGRLVAQAGGRVDWLLSEPASGSYGRVQVGAESVALGSGGLTASAAGLVPVEPPASWFDDPQLSGPTALTITKTGRVYGHLALFGVCHQGSGPVVGRSDCLMVPRSKTRYAYFHLGCVHCDDGKVVDTGRLFSRTPHAPLESGVGARAAADFYADNGTGWADVRVGEDRFGPWVAGALLPDVAASEVRRLRGCALSGDWRWQNGSLELCGVISVNSPGFPVAKTEVLVAASGENPHALALVAASIVDADAVRAASRAVAGLRGTESLAVARAAVDGVEGLAALIRGAA